MPETKIEIRHLNLESLIHDMGKGTLRIPRFQRDYVWERQRVANLFDSIYHEFPIGSFFLWITPREYNHLFKDIPELQLPDPADYEQIKMILDGQQRITSLFVAIKGLSLNSNGNKKRDYNKICFDLDGKVFLVVKRSEDKERIISVRRFFDRQGENEIYDKLTEERRLVFRDCQYKLTTYPISLVEVKDKHLDDAITIFERINQGGKRLNLFDLVVASTWSPNFDLKEKADTLRNKLDKSGFGKIYYETIIQTVSLLAKNQCTRVFQLQLKTEDIVKYWPEAEKGLLLATDYLRQNLGVRIFDFIPYPAILPPLAWLFAKNQKNSLSDFQSSFVKKWFWRTAFSQRYGASTLTLVGDDINDHFKPLINEQRVELRIPVSITVDDIATLRINVKSAVKNALLCILAMKQPLHFRNGAPIILDYNFCSDYNSKEKHHIFPDSFLKNQKVKHRNLIANFAFLPNELNKEITNKKPSIYFPAYRQENNNFGKALNSHLIPHSNDSGIWTDDYGLFIRQRSELFLDEINKLT